MAAVVFCETSDEWNLSAQQQGKSPTLTKRAWGTRKDQTLERGPPAGCGSEDVKKRMGSGGGLYLAVKYKNTKAAEFPKAKLCATSADGAGSW